MRDTPWLLKTQQIILKTALHATGRFVFTLDIWTFVDRTLDFMYELPSESSNFTFGPKKSEKRQSDRWGPKSFVDLSLKFHALSRGLILLLYKPSSWWDIFQTSLVSHNNLLPLFCLVGSH